MSFASPRATRTSASERISLRELQDVYGCPTRRDAMKLALDQSNSLGAASSRLVDLLFDYFKEKTGVNSTQTLVRSLSFGDTHNLNSNSNSRGEMGLSLPASAIGWLASHLLPNESDIQYHRQWEDVQVEYCLPHASPTPQVQSKLSLLKLLLQSHVTHLRVTHTAWPGTVGSSLLAAQITSTTSRRGKSQRTSNFESFRTRGRMLLNFDADSVSSFLQFYRRLQQRPRIDVRLFPEVQYVSFHGIPADWIQNLLFARDTLVRLLMQGCQLRRNLAEVLLDESGGCKDYMSETTGAKVLLDDGMISSEDHDHVGSTSNRILFHYSKMGKDVVQLCQYSSLQHLILKDCGICDSCLILTTTHGGYEHQGRVNQEETLTGGVPIFDLLPALVTIDLSHNRLVNMEHVLGAMKSCPCLRVVDMSYNRIRSMVGSDVCIGNIEVLLLSNNYIRSVHGLDRLYSLERLSLDNNLLANLSDISKLAKLPNLQQLSLLGNPIVFQDNRGEKKYRIQVLNLFKESRLQGNDSKVTFGDILQLLPTLDGMKATRRELKLLKYLSFGQRIPKGNTTLLLQPKDALHAINDRCHQKESVDDTQIDVTPTPMNPSHVTRNATRFVAIIRDIDGTHENRRKNVDRNFREISRPTAFGSIENVIESIDRSGTVERKKSSQDDSNSPDKSANSPSEDNGIYYESLDRSLTSSIPSPDDDVKEISIPEISPLLLIDVENEKDATSPRDNMAYDGNTKDSNNDAHVDNLQQDYPADFKPDSFPTGDYARSDSLINKDTGQNAQDWSLFTEEGIPQSSETETKINQSLDTKVSQIDFASMERNDVYNGPGTYSNLCISEYYDLYFRCFVFPTTQMNESVDIGEEITDKLNIPKIQLYQTDRELMMAFSMKQETNGISPLLHTNNTEYLISVTKESIIPCGIAATARIQPLSRQVKNAKGSVLYSNNVPYVISESQKLLLCVTNKAIYFIPDFSDATTDHRPFPSPIGIDSAFSSGYWPHAYCRHPVKYLRKITFDGYGFQKLTLFFKLPSIHRSIYAGNEMGDMSAYDYTYVIYTYSQRDTIRLLQTFQQAVKDARPDTKTEVLPSSLAIENENIITTKAIGRTLARPNFGDDILHYQILYQTWKNNNCQPVDRRSFVLTNKEVFLFNETYGGDLSTCTDDDKFPCSCYGDIRLRTIASASIENIVNVCISRDDSMMVIITFGSSSKIRWSSSLWQLKCISLENAELLINDIRNVAPFLSS